MYAVVDIGGKQAKVETGTLVAVEKIDAEVGATVNLRVLTVADGDRLVVKPADLTNATVSAEIVEHFLGEKAVIFKFQKRKGYKRTKGHRQMLTNLRITDIALDGKTAAKPAKAEAAPKKEAAPKAEKPKAEAAPKAEAPKQEAAPKAEKPAKVEAAAVAPAAEKQCAAVKSDGTQCANKAKDGSDYCGVHAKKYEG